MDTVGYKYRITTRIKAVSHAQTCVSDAVRAVLRDCKQCRNYNLCYVSDKLGMSTRTLSRKLNKEGVRFQCILDYERKALCEELMSSGITDAQDLSITLGFSDTSHFYKKFKEWNSISFYIYKNENYYIKTSNPCTLNKMPHSGMT